MLKCHRQDKPIVVQWILQLETFRIAQLRGSSDSYASFDRRNKHVITDQLAARNTSGLGRFQLRHPIPFGKTSVVDWERGSLDENICMESIPRWLST